MTTQHHKNLKARLLDMPEYGLAEFVYADATPDELIGKIASGGGVPFLKMASGLVGVLRALAVRCGRILIDKGQPFTLVEIRLVDGTPIAHFWKVVGA